MTTNINGDYFDDHTFTFENIGPLKNSQIKLSDLVLFFGPPNTGKSYALRSIYSTLMPLDEIMYRSLFNTYTYRFKKGYSFISKHLVSQAKTLMKFLEFVGRCHSQQIPLNTIISDYNNGESLIRKLDIPIKVNAESNSISLILEDAASFNIDSRDIIDSIYAHVVDKYKSFIPYGETSKILLDGIDSFDLYRNLIRVDTKKEVVLDMPYSIQERLLASKRMRLGYGNFEIEVKAKYSSGSNPEYPFNFDSVEFIYPFVSNSLGNFVTPVYNELNMSNKMLEYAQVIESLAKMRITLSKQKVAESEFRILLGFIIRTVFLTIGRESLLSIQRNLRGSMGFSELRFVPVGRTNFINLLEYIIGNPLERSESINSSLDRMQGGLYLSYLKWIGRGKDLLSGNLDAQNSFYPVLQGRLSIDKTTGRLIYDTWNNYHIPLSISSALASEVSGIILSYLTIGESGLLLIEEPEAQMHPTAQFLTGILLIALAKIGNIKIVVTTHSDLMMTAIAMIVNLKPSSEQILNIIKKLLPSEIETENYLKDLSNRVAKNAKQITVNPYFFNGTGIDYKDVSSLGTDIPSISKTIDNIVDWGYRISLD